MKNNYSAIFNKSKVFIFALSFFLLPASLLFAQTTVPFNYTGNPQTFTVPAGVTSIDVKIWGAGGAGSSTGGSGGSGAFVKGTIAVMPSQSLVVIVGGGGSYSASVASPGGFGGGGNAGAKDGGSGGGYSGIFDASVSHNNTLAIAGGGAGGGHYTVGTYGGAGGATSGSDGGDVNGDYTGGKGGNVIVGGAGGFFNGVLNGVNGFALTGGSGGNDGTNTYGGGGGGGGYYGGGGGFGGSGTFFSSGGGGGSSFLGTMTGVTNTQGNFHPFGSVTQAPGNLEAGYVAGVGNGSGNSTEDPGGNGLVIITYTVGSTPTITSFDATSACLGTTPTITITGTNFTGVTAVKFNGVDATSFNFVSETSITAVLPATGVSTGIITVIATAGTGESTSNFMINAVPSEATDAVGASTCGTGSVTLSVDNPGTGFTIDWYAASSSGTALATGTTSYTTPNISGTTNYYAEVRNTVTGCVSATRLVVTATFNALPASPTIPVNKAICGPGTTTISVTPPTGATIDWYNASTGGTLLQSSSNSYTTPSSISVTTIYYAQARNTTTGCISAARTEVTVTVNAVPDPPAGVDNSRCGTGIVALSASRSGAVIDWYANATVGTALLSGNNNYSPNISATTIYYAESRIASTGCISATRTAVIATINILPTITTQPAASQTICLGTTATFTSVAGGTPALTYQWKKDGMDISGATFATYTIPSVTEGDAATYTVIATNSCGSATSTNSVLITTTAGSWLGVTSTDWFTASNWGCGIVPTVTTDVTIPVTAPNMPDIGAGAVCRDITINGTLTITGTPNLKVYGNWTNNNTFTPATGTVSIS